MDWREKIIIGISFIKEGCTEAGNHNCDYCPFEKYCDEPFPINWDLKSEG